MTNPTRRAQLQQLLDQQPRFPISILPTPLVELPRLGAALAGCASSSSAMI